MIEPLFDWSREQRSSGMLLHPTSLPNPYGIGNLGTSALSFINTLKKSGMKFWQVLPLSPTGYGDSPYQSYSSYAINPYLLDWDQVLEYGWITSSDLIPLEYGNSDVVDFDALRDLHPPLRKKAIENGIRDVRFKESFAEYKKKNAHWIKDYALFIVLKALNNGLSWIEWKKEHREYDSAKSALGKSKKIQKEIDLIAFEQFILDNQWQSLKEYANSLGIQIIGDIPIYVSYDSVDVWANRSVFQLTKTGSATKLAGVPPDYFNENGQFWGNPLYNWKYLKETDFKWWMDRLKHTLSLFDVVRFDHFRGLAAYWSIPAKATTAKEGKWVKGPGIDFFEQLKQQIPSAKLILEDLGEITPDVIELKNMTGFPGLAVLQFAFGGKADNFYLPHNVAANTVIYTGTHDNDTSLGWYQSTNEQTRDHFRQYLQVSGNDAPWDLIRTAYRSTAEICIIPAQDILALGSEARMNIPGIATGNWRWRISHDQLSHIENTSSGYLHSIASLYGRIHD